jgi:MOSC domain-containing protein YiiM
MNDKRFPKLFSQSCYVGGYLRVLDVGKISREDELKVVKKEPNSLSLFDIADLIFKDIDNVEKMKKALDIASLTEEIKEKFRERLIKLEDFSSV